jgi:hypothetical protein
VEAYTPLPPFAKSKKKKPVKKNVLAEAAKKQQDYLNQAVKYKESAMMNSYTPPSMTEYRVSIAPKKSFFTKLRELFSD